MLHLKNAISCGIRVSVCNRVGLVFLVALLAGGARAVADPPVTHGAAFGEQLALSLQVGALTTQASSGPLPAVSGDVPPFTQDANAASLSIGLGAFGTVLSTGLLQSHTASAAGGPISSSAVVHGVALLPSALLLNFHASEVRSSAALGGTCGVALTATGATTLANAELGGLLGGGLRLGVSYPPNTVLLNLLGARVVVNEQIVSGDGVTSRALAVNALHISLQNSLLAAIGRLNGDLVIAHAEARVVCPPPHGGDVADLSLNQGVNAARVSVGAQLTYGLAVANAGPNGASNVVVTDPLPAGLQLLSATASQGVCSGTTTVLCNLGAVPAGGGATVTLTVQTQTTGTLVNPARVASGATDPNAANNTATTTVTVLPAAIRQNGG